MNRLERLDRRIFGGLYVALSAVLVSFAASLVPERRWADTLVVVGLVVHLAALTVALACSVMAARAERRGQHVRQT